MMKKHWGYDRFLPLQREAMGCVASGRDSVVVPPTGGGKSLYYQVPALLGQGPAVVVSPLVALMKDQVDGLKERGVAAAPMWMISLGSWSGVAVPPFLTTRA